MDPIVDENVTPLQAKTPGSGSKNVAKAILLKSTSGTATFRNAQKFDDSLARAVNGETQVTPTKTLGSGVVSNTYESPSDAYLKPSSVKRLQQMSDSEKCMALEQENVRLREALKQLKMLTANQTQLVINSAAIVEGAKKYVLEKTVNTQKTPHRRYNHNLSVRVLSWENLDTHVEYHIEIKMGADLGHTLKKRYSEFLGLRQRLLTVAERAAQSDSCSLFWNRNSDEVSSLTLRALRNAQLPPKLWFGNFDENTIDARCEQLQAYLDEVLKASKRAGRGAAVRSIISDWLGIHRCDEDSVWCDDRIKPLREFDSRAKQARVSEAFEHLLSQSPIKKAIEEQALSSCSPAGIVSGNAEKDLELL